MDINKLTEYWNLVFDKNNNNLSHQKIAEIVIKLKNGSFLNEYGDEKRG